MIVRLISVAEEEFSKSAEYYENQREGLGEEFVAEVLRAAGILQDFPRIGTPIGTTFRAFAIRRFPYSLVYRIGADELIVVAVTHQSREPGYWKNRT
ncbi:MAG: type II toxin-antitoxin system RelE/ParE family toxin [Pyrinomonadaceae bacterium]